MALGPAAQASAHIADRGMDKRDDWIMDGDDEVPQAPDVEAADEARIALATQNSAVRLQAQHLPVWLEDLVSRTLQYVESVVVNGAANTYPIEEDELTVFPREWRSRIIHNSMYKQASVPLFLMAGVQPLEQLRKQLSRVLELCDTATGDFNWLSRISRFEHTTELLAALDEIVVRCGDFPRHAADWGRRFLPEQIKETWIESIRRAASPATDLSRDIESSRAMTSIEESRLSAEQSARAATEAAGVAAGETGEAGVAAAFGRFAQRHSRISWLWRAIALSIAVGATWLAGEHLVDPGLDATDVARRIATGVPLAVIAGYALYEASLHRAHQLWAEHVAVQLRTVHAYCADLPAQQKADLKAALGRSLFTGQPPDIRTDNNAPRKSGSISES
jgi:hypothetical protein